jgi:hypothetical protein
LTSSTEPEIIMSAKEATARIKINKLLDGAGWRFFADGDWSSRTKKNFQSNLDRVWGKQR